MQTSRTLCGNAQTYLAHVFGRSLDDNRHLVERLQSVADGEIRLWCSNGQLKKDQRKDPRKVP